MAPNKAFPSAREAVADISDGSTVMIAGYGAPGTPEFLVKALMDSGVGGLTCISGPWYGRDPHLYDAARLVANGRVKSVITATPLYPDPQDTALKLWRAGRLQLEIVPQGTLAERIRAGGAGLGGVLLPMNKARAAEDGKEARIVAGQACVLEMSLKADFALLRAHKADTLGNLVYRRTQRNWNPIMAAAADVSVVEVDELVQPGELDPELVITPGIYVDRIVVVERESP